MTRMCILQMHDHIVLPLGSSLMFKFLELTFKSLHRYSISCNNPKDKREFGIIPILADVPEGQRELGIKTVFCH